jgi:hypothetical protein
MGIWLFLAWRVPERLRRRGLTESEARRFAYEAPLSRAAFWSRPSVAALLDEPQPAPRPTRGAPSGEPTSLETRTMFEEGERRPTKKD